MKSVLKPRRPSPDEALAIAANAAPQQPPAQIKQAEREGEGEGADTPTTLNLRMRRSSVYAIEAAAKAQGLTMKQVVAHALNRAGVAMADADLEDRTPRRK